MQLTPNLNLKKPEGTDVVDIADLNENTDKLDTEVAKLASTTAPGRMSVADKTKLDGATSAATASTLVQRDASGRFKAATPAVADDVARKAEVDAHAAVVATTGAAGHVQLNSATNSTSTTQAATPSAVKAAYDLASTAKATSDAALPKTGGRSTGSIVLESGSSDTPELGFNDPGNNTYVYMDLANEIFRAFGVYRGSGVKFPFAFDMSNNRAQVFERDVITSAGGQAIYGSLELVEDLVLHNNRAVLSRKASGGVARIAHYSIDDTLRLGDPGSVIKTFDGYDMWHTGRLRINNGVLEFYYNGGWIPVGGVRSIQRGVTDVSHGVVNVPIAALSAINKAQVNLLTSMSTDTISGDFYLSLRLTSVNNLEISKTGYGSTIKVSWEVIESN